MNTATTPADIDSYIAACPDAVRERLHALRQAIREAAPDATEAMAYGMPTFRLNGNLVHFAAWKAHIGFYPTPSGTTAFAEELSGFRQSKGSVQFPLDQPLPLDLVRRMVAYRREQQLALAAKKKK